VRWLISNSITTEDKITSLQNPDSESPYLPLAKDFYSDSKDSFTSITGAITGEAAAHADLAAIEARVKVFAEASKVLMKGLDEVAKVHPFVGGSKFFSYKNAFLFTF
jgi:hypothetical protein